MHGPQVLTVAYACLRPRESELGLLNDAGAGA